MTSQEMIKHAQLKPGYWFENIAPIGSSPDWRVAVAPLPGSDLLFGYQPPIFMAKQYKPAA